jgi:hypothetical protein
MAIDNAERNGQRGDNYTCEFGHEVETNSTADFFNSIALGQENLVRDFIEQYPEISNTPNEHGETPLIAAVRADKPTIVRDLLWNGAKVDTLAKYSRQDQSGQAWRTALQVAAAEGKLHMIRILRENRANVFLIAPDGVTALQLARSKKHESVVEHIQKAYASIIGSSLVAQSGLKPNGLTDAADPVGCQRPVKLVPAQCVQKHKKSSIITWAVPKFVLDKTPTTVISAINVLADKPQETRLLRRNVKLWCQEQIQKFPTRGQKGIDLADRGTKGAVELVMKTPEGALTVMKRTPNAIWTIMLYIGMALCKLGDIAPFLFKQLKSVAQTIAKAVASIPQAVTLHGIQQGFNAVLQTVITEISKHLAALVAEVKQTYQAMLQAIVGSLKKIIIIFAALTLGICILFSKRAWGLLQAPAKLAKKGMQELLERMGPKIM